MESSECVTSVVKSSVVSFFLTDDTGPRFEMTDCRA
jgi:hypothetical protein